MAQTAALVDALKRALKQNGVRYSDVAAHLDISESTVKRLFAEASFSLKRLDQICQLMQMEMSDLLGFLRDTQKLRALTREQERELVADPARLLIANNVLNRWTFADLQSIYRFDTPELVGHLVKLDRLGLIQLQPNNRIKVLVDRDFSWLRDGPIAQFYETQLKNEFFNGRFNQGGERRMIMTGMLSRESNAIMQRHLDKLNDVFHNLHREDEKLPLADKFGTTLVVGMRLWEPAVFEELRRAPDTRAF